MMRQSGVAAVVLLDHLSDLIISSTSLTTDNIPIAQGKLYISDLSILTLGPYRGVSTNQCSGPCGKCSSTAQKISKPRRVEGLTTFRLRREWLNDRKDGIIRVCVRGMISASGLVGSALMPRRNLGLHRVSRLGRTASLSDFLGRHTPSMLIARYQALVYLHPPVIHHPPCLSTIFCSTFFSTASIVDHKFRLGAIVFGLWGSFIAQQVPSLRYVACPSILLSNL